MARTRRDNIVVERSVTNLRDGALQLFTASLYGGMAMATPTVDNIAAGWQPVDVYDMLSTTPRGVALSLANGSFIPTDAAVFMLHWGFSFSHTESQQSRTIYWRVWNMTDGVQQTTPQPIGIARNQPETFRQLSFMFEVSPGIEDKELRFEIGNGDDMGPVTWNSVNLAIHSISEWRGEWPPSA